MTDQLKRIAVAQVKDIYYDYEDDQSIMHIGCGYPGTDTHVSACGYRDPQPFDSDSIDETPEEYVCLGCIVATQNNNYNVCWKTGQNCVCDNISNIQT
jgi:hypothetical protein